MLYRIGPFLMTSSGLQGHSPKSAIVKLSADRTLYNCSSVASQPYVIIKVDMGWATRSAFGL